MRLFRGPVGAWTRAVALGWMLGPATTGRAQEEIGAPPPLPASPAEARLPGPDDPSTPSDSVDSTSKTAEGAPAAAQPPRGIGRESILEIFQDANPMLWPLALCSVVALGFTLERMVALRKGRVLPRDFIQRFLERLSAGKLDRERALELCRAHESPAARIFGYAIRYWGQPAAVIRQAVDADAAGEVAEMKRNIRALNGTATLSPLLGLLGTVIGLIEAFDALGGTTSDGMPKGEALAHGISLALVATAIGLAIAILSVIAYFFLLNRVDVLVRDLDEQTRKVIELISAETAWVGAERRVGVGPMDRNRPEGRPI